MTYRTTWNAISRRNTMRSSRFIRSGWVSGPAPVLVFPSDAEPMRTKMDIALHPKPQALLAPTQPKARGLIVMLHLEWSTEHMMYLKGREPEN
jgi:hypothetical protein